MNGWHECTPAPHRLIGADGQVVYGWWRDAVADLGLSALRIPDPMGGFKADWHRFLRLKRWEFWSLDLGDLLVGLALIDLGYARSFFAYVAQPGLQKLRSVQVKAPGRKAMGMRLEWPQGCLTGETMLQLRRGFVRVDAEDQFFNLSFDIPELAVQANLRLKRVEPLSLCVPAGANGWTYTCKEVAMQITGTCHVSGRPRNLARALASVDRSLGLMRRETAWQWCSLMGWHADQPYGLNVAMGVNESGQTENAFWLDGTLHKFGSISFHPVEHGCKVKGDHVDLDFKGMSRHKEHLNLGLLASRFTQWQGRYQGVIGWDGQRYAIDAQGLWEDHFVRW